MAGSLTFLLRIYLGKRPLEFPLISGYEWCKGWTAVSTLVCCPNPSSDLKGLFPWVVAIAAETQSPVLNLLSKLPPQKTSTRPTVIPLPSPACRP